MVCSNLEYCPSIWNPHQKDQIQKLEMIQRRAAQYTTNRYRNTSSVYSMLDHLQWESLESRRSKIQLTLLYEIVNDMIDIPEPKENPGQDLHIRRSTDSAVHLQIHLNTVFPPTPSLCGILFQNPLLRPLRWYHSRETDSTFLLKC